jgi:hypothetical protein
MLRSRKYMKTRKMPHNLDGKPERGDHFVDVCTYRIIIHFILKNSGVMASTGLIWFGVRNQAVFVNNTNVIRIDDKFPYF